MARIKYPKLIFSGLVWIPLFLDVWDRFCSRFFGFSPLTLSDWQDRFHRFIHSDWVIHSGRDWALLLCMFLSIPLLILGWCLIYRIDWRRFITRTAKKVAIKPAGAQTPEHRVFKPAQLRIQTGAIMHVNPAVSPAPSAQPTQMTAPQPQPSAPPQQAYEDEAEVQEMLSQTAGLAADFFPHVKLDGAYASFALSTEKKAAIVTIIDRPDSTLAVDTDIDVLQSDWFFETGTIPTPAKDVIAISKNLHDNEPDSVALPVILLMGGTLLNVDETLDYYEKNNVLLLRTENVDADSIPLFSDFVQEYFAPGDDSNTSETADMIPDEPLSDADVSSSPQPEEIS